MILQYFSDIHLEFYQENISKIRRLFDVSSSKADILLCAGDIGKPSHQSYRLFLQDMSLKFEKVYFITGNHEYYGTDSMEKVNTLCSDIARAMPHNNVHFLQNDHVQLIDGLHLFGGTLWTHIPKQCYTSVSSSICDYQKIPGFTPDVSNRLHQETLTSLSAAVEQAVPTYRWIVLSHHMPSYQLIDPQYGTPCMQNINCGFASEVDFARDPRIHAWVYGHTHLPYQQGKFYCNPIGYPGENKRWTLQKFIDL